MNDRIEYGTVIWFDPNRGYGFISRSRGDDLFVHWSDIQMNGYKSLNRDDRVSYIVTPGSNNKLQAEKVTLLEC